jgi:hypothetical protein
MNLLGFAKNLMVAAVVSLGVWGSSQAATVLEQAADPEQSNREEALADAPGQHRAATVRAKKVKEKDHAAAPGMLIAPDLGKPSPAALGAAPSLGPPALTVGGQGLSNNDPWPAAPSLQTTALTIASSAPEPAAWALMISGFAMVGIGLRLRRREEARGEA